MLQRSQEWHRARLGSFTASEVGKLLGSSRSKSATFSATALSLIYRKLGERLLSPEMLQDEERFGEYLYRTEVRSKAMEYGTRTEAEAVSFYSTLNGCEVDDGSFWQHETIPYFAASPDGLVGDDGLVEIKCPQVEAFGRYYATIFTPEDIKRENADYYWQMQAQMSCTGRLWCDWLAYSPDCGNRVVLVRVPRNADDIALLEKAILNANAFIDEVMRNGR